MVALFVRLKLRLLANQLRGSVTQVLLLVVSGLFALGAAVVGVGVAVSLRLADLDIAGAAVVSLGSLTVLTWALLPVLLATDDDTSDPVRFALLPLRPRQLAAGLLAASVVGFFPAATLLGSLATVVTWSRSGFAVLVALLSVPLAFLTCLLVARAVLTIASAALASRRGRELVAGAGILALSGLGLLGPALGLVAGGLRSGSLDAAVQVLAWSPVGAVWAAPWAAADGRPVVALGRLGVAVLTIALLWLAYTRALQRRIRPHRAPGRKVRDTHELSRSRDILPDTPFGALVLRCLRYWRRDSRYTVSVIALPVVTVVLLLLPRTVDGAATLSLTVGPFLASLLALTMVNELAFDGTALWTTLSTEMRGRTERAARTAALLLWGAPVTIVVTVVSALLAARLDLLPATLGLSLGVLLVGNGVAAVTSVWLAYPVPGPGANPFTSSNGGGTAGLLSQGVGLLASGVLTLPLLGLGVGAWLVPVLGWVLVVAGPLYGAVVLWVGIRLGGDRLDRSGPELLARLAA